MSKSQGKALSTESYKGVRDFYPEEMFIENYIFDVWRKTVQSFGYVEYNASLLEPSELYKTKSSDEIVNEQTYSFLDRGGREVTLRPEMTPTVARMVAARRRDLTLPIRWFSIPNVFRYERPQRGRLREHFQLNVDIFGVSTQDAEIEIISIAYTLLKNFGLSDKQFVIKINDKDYVRKALADLGLSEEKSREASVLLDKKNKIETFEKDWRALTGKDWNEHSFENPNLKSFVSFLKERGVPNVEADPTLVRGFEYYSGIVFEVFDVNPENKRSLFGGGRYDNLLSLFGEDNMPAVGFGMGDVTIRDVLESYKLLPEYESPVKLYICILDEKYTDIADTLSKNLRENGVTVAIDFSFRKIGDQIKKADKDKIPFVLFVGENEATTQKFTVKDLRNGKEHLLTTSEIPACIKGK